MEADNEAEEKGEEAISELHDEIKRCRRCRLYRTRRKAVPGEGPSDAAIMICGQSPGRTEDREGRPFIGMAGKLLSELLRSIGLDRQRIFITSTVKCFPPRNRPPRTDELEACTPYLEKQIEIIKPRVIVALGNFALQTLIDKKLNISQVHGTIYERDGITVFPTFHPAAALRLPKVKAYIRKDFERLRRLLIEAGLI